jgi:hypothetical protein
MMGDSGLIVFAVEDEVARAVKWCWYLYLKVPRSLR